MAMRKRWRSGALCAAAGSALLASATTALALPVAAVTDFVQLDAHSVRSEAQQRYIVLLSDAPAATYRGGISGLMATSPAVRGTGRLDLSSPEVQTYMAHLDQKQEDFLARAQRDLARGLEVGHRYRVALNGMVLEMTAGEAARMQRLSGVKSVFPDTLDPILTDTGPVFIGAGEIWNGDHGAALESRGEGMIVGILDTGMTPGHASFAATDPVDAYAHVNPFGADTYVGVCDSTSDQYDASFDCNDKLIGAWSFIDNWGEESAWDENGHGSHVAGTAAGNNVAITFQGVPVTISGVAPRANIISYRVCGGPDMLCAGSDRAAAIEQSILDGVDVLNHSIGGGASPYSDAASLAFLNATDAGIFSAASAGNSGPGPETVGHRAPWMATVAATTHGRLFAHSVDITGPGTPPGELTGIAGVPGTGPTPTGTVAAELIHALDHAVDAEGCAAFPADTFDGAVAFISRGGCAFADKVGNATDAGAIGVVVYNNTPGAATAMGGLESTTIPSVMITQADGQEIINWFASSDPDPVSVEISQSSARIVDPSTADVVASFSSRGPGGGMADILSPDVAAPGVSILAATIPDVGDPGVDQYMAIQGTSMASPHVAGAGALMKAIRADWTPMEIHSALMSTAVTSLTKEDGVTPADAFDIGAGRIDIGRAARAGLVLHESKASFEAADPALDGDLTSLNIASLSNRSCDASCDWSREVRNVLGQSGSWTVTLNSDVGLALSVDQASFTLADNASQTLTVTADVSLAEPGEWLFGEVVITEDTDQAPSQRFPVAVRTPEPVEYGHYTMTTSWEDATCAMPFANDGGYVDLRAFGINPLDGVEGNATIWSAYADRTFNVFGGEFAGGLSLTDDGFVYFGDSGPALPGTNTDLTSLPGVAALFAPFWRNWQVVYEAGARGISLGSTGDLAIIDWKAVEDIGDSSIRSDFQVSFRMVPSETAHDIVFAVNNVQVPDTTGTVGISGHEGADWRRHAFNDARIAELEDGDAFCFNWVAGISAPTFEPTVTGFTEADMEVTLQAFPQTASLRYTTDGITDPDPDTGTIIANGGSITVTDGMEVRVIAYEGDHVSDVETRTYQQIAELVIVDEHSDPLESVTVGAGSEVSFSVSGGSGSYSDVSSSVNQTSGVSADVIDDGGGNYRFVAPSTGAFAGTYEVTVTDATGVTRSFTVEVSLDIGVERSELLGGVESSLLHVRGAVPGTNLNLELQDAGGIALPSETVASLEDSMVTAISDEPEGHPASTTVSALVVSEPENFRLRVSGSPYSDVVSELIDVQVPSWYAGHVFDMAGDGIEAAGVRTKDAVNELSEPYRTETANTGAFLLGAPVVGELDPEHVLSISADDFLMQEIDGALCLGETPVCTLYLEGATGYLTVGVPDLLAGEEIDLFIHFDTVLEDEGEVGPFELTGSGDGDDSKVLSLDGALTYQRIVGTGYGYQESEADGGGDGFTPTATASETAQAELLMVPTVPMIEDPDVDSIDATSARLFATVDPNQRATSISFMLDDGGNLETIDGGSLAANAAADEVSVMASGLTCGTSYGFFVFAENDKAASADSASVSFDTADCDDDDGDTPPGGGGGGNDSFFSCSMGNGNAPIDPTLPLLVLFGLMWFAGRRRALR